MSKGVKSMWKVVIKPYVWVESEVKQISYEFECDTLEEAVNLMETLRKHSNISRFEMINVEKE